MTPFDLDNPISVPAKTLDRLWIVSFYATSQGPGQQTFLNVALQTYNDAGDTGPVIHLDLIDVLKEAATDPMGAAVYAGLLNWVKLKARVQGKI
jgi:hypothetical protein